MSRSYYQYDWVRILNNFLQIIEHDIESPRLEELLQYNDLPNIADEIRQNPEARTQIIQILKNRIHTLEIAYENRIMPVILKRIEKELAEFGKMSTDSKGQINAYPRLIKMLAEKYNLINVNNRKEFMKEFKRKYHFKLCEIYKNPHQCLRDAAKLGLYDRVVELMNDPRIINLNDAAVTAIRQKHNDIAKLLISDPRFTKPTEAIERTAGVDNLEMVNLLLQDPRVVNLNYAISKAAEKGNVKLVDRLLADPRVTDIDGAVDTAILNKKFDIVQRLLMDTRAINLDLNAAITFAISVGNIVLFDQLFHDRNRVTDLNPAINTAVLDGNIEIVRRLLQDDRVTDLERPVYDAIDKNNIDMVILLLQDNHGRRVGLNDNVYHAIPNRDEILKIIVQDPRLTNLNHIINTCVEEHKIDALKILISDPRVTNLNQALALAVRKRFSDIVELLLESPKVTDITEALKIAIETSNLYFVKRLLGDARINNISLFLFNFQIMSLAGRVMSCKSW